MPGRGRPAAALAVLVVAAWAVQHLRYPAVRGWRPGAGECSWAGPLAVRTSGTGDRVVVLLHGLPASGETFGAAYDGLAAHGRVVVPDLLGFGRSQHAAGTGFALPDHLAALDAMAEALDLGSRRLVVAGHSMGALLAWHWAAGRAEQVDAVVGWCAPLFADRDDAARRLERKTPGLALLGLPGPVSRTLCQQLCTRRPVLASWLYALLYPRLPVALSRQLTAHTWDSYAGAMTGIVLGGQGRREALRRLHEAGVPVVHAVGARDVLAPADAVSTLGEDARALTVVVHPTGDHLLPLDRPSWCLRVLQDATTLRDAGPAGRRR